MSLPQNLPYELMLTQWAYKINPYISNPIVLGRAINSIFLSANTPTTIPIGLNRMQQGWFLIDNNADCRVWRTEALNAQTLTLESNADTTISIWVF
jgi:hypothetical protein